MRDKSEKTLKSHFGITLQNRAKTLKSRENFKISHFRIVNHKGRKTNKQIWRQSFVASARQSLMF